MTQVQVLVLRDVALDGLRATCPAAGWSSYRPGIEAGIAQEGSVGER